MTAVTNQTIATAGTIPAVPSLLLVMAFSLLFPDISALVSRLQPNKNGIKRMKPDEYRKARRERVPIELDKPILVEQALGGERCEALCHDLIKLTTSKPVVVQEQNGINKQSANTLLHDCTIGESVDYLMDSTPNQAFFAFCEGLLEGKDTNDIREELEGVRESLFVDSSDATNWFDYFPVGAKPHDCVVMAGQGARSTFHRDPFEWTGTSLCLEGRKIWRFLEPLEDMDTLLHARRLKSIAWGDKDKMVLSAGWESDEYSLFGDVNGNSMELPSAEQLSEMSETDAFLERFATQSLPPALPSEKANELTVFTTVQKPGDLLLIPPYWYHQTFAPEPSIAVASQRCGSTLDVKRVLSHILALQHSDAAVPIELTRDIFKDDSVKDTVQMLFNYLRTCQQED